MNNQKTLITILTLLIFNICYPQEFEFEIMDANYARKEYSIRTESYESVHKKELPKKIKDTLDVFAKKIGLGKEDKIDVYQNFAVFTKNSLKTIFTLEGKQISSSKFNSFFELHPSKTLFKIENNSKWGIFNSKKLKDNSL